MCLGKLSGLKLIKIKPFGSFVFYKTEKVWFSIVKNISPTNDVELLIEVYDFNQDLTEKINLIKEFVSDIDSITEKLQAYVYKHCFSKTKKTLTEVKKMYYLCAIELKKDDKTWWIGLESSNENKSIDNHFVRFTLVNKEIVWSNIKTKEIYRNALKTTRNRKR